jgi:hypothetical protein
MRITNGTAVAAVALSQRGVGFDGALDVFRSDTPVSLRQALMHQVIAWPATTAIMWTVFAVVMGEALLRIFL